MGRGHLDGLLQGRALEHVVSADDLLGLGERPVLTSTSPSRTSTVPASLGGRSRSRSTQTSIRNFMCFSDPRAGVYTITTNELPAKDPRRALASRPLGEI